MMGCAPGGEKYLLYNSTMQEYTSQRSVMIDKLCNGVTVINKGNTIAMWNGLPLAPDESMTIGGNIGEVYVGRVDISFSLPTPVPPTPVNSAWVIQKFYEDKNFVG